MDHRKLKHLFTAFVASYGAAPKKCTSLPEQSVTLLKGGRPAGRVRMSGTLLSLLLLVSHLREVRKSPNHTSLLRGHFPRLVIPLHSETAGTYYKPLFKLGSRRFQGGRLLYNHCCWRQHISSTKTSDFWRCLTKSWSEE